jgi:uncharacterized protein (TIGR02118 family)
MTREEFKNRWLNEHLKLSSQIPNLLGYYVNIAINHQPDGDGVQPFFDGTAELWFKDIETMEAAFASQKGVVAGVDADLFSDVRIHIYTEEHEVIRGPVR